MSTRTPITLMAQATPSRSPLAARPQRTRRARSSRWLAALPVAAGLVTLLPQTGHASISCSDYAAAHAPTFYFHPDEQYLPMTMTAFIKHSTLKDADDNVLASSMSSVADLINASEGDSDEYLEMDEDWGTDTHNIDVGIYYNCADHTDEAYPYVDIMYSFLTAYNGCEGMRTKTVDVWGSNAKKRNFAMCSLGRHYGDWEHVTVRQYITDPLQQIITNAHGDSYFWGVTGSVASPRVYVALNTHGTWPFPGTWTTYDVYDDSGFTDVLGILAIEIANGLVTYFGMPRVQSIEVVDITTTSELLDTSGGAYHVLTPDDYTLSHIKDTSAIYDYTGRWGQTTSNKHIDGPVGNIPNINDDNFTSAVQDAMDNGGLNDYKTGKGPTGPWTKDWWIDGE
ncbi:MAG: Vps62-related protein [Nannocystaceae bacterium]